MYPDKYCNDKRIGDCYNCDYRNNCNYPNKKGDD